MMSKRTFCQTRTSRNGTGRDGGRGMPGWCSRAATKRITSGFHPEGRRFCGPHARAHIEICEQSGLTYEVTEIESAS